MSDLERKLLAKLTTPEAIEEVWDAGVRPDLFEEPLLQAVFNFTVQYWRESQMSAAPTAWVLSQEYPGFTLGEEGEELTGYLSDLLRRRYVTNQLQEMLRSAATDSVKDPLGALKTLHAAAYSASEAVAPRLTRVNLGEIIEEFKADYEQAEQFPQGQGVPFGLDLFDLHTGGTLPGELVVIGARAKTGKTMFLLHAAVSALRQGYKPLIFTLEMSIKEINTRLASLFSGISYDRLSHKRLRDPEKDRLWEALEEYRSLGGISVEAPEEGDRTVPALIARARQYGTDYLIIDQLSEMEAGHRTQTLKEHHASVVKQLKREINRAGMEVPCLLAAQLRRNDEEITMESFSNATEIEATADLLLGLWRNQDMRNNSAMALKILGSRRCDISEFVLGWELQIATQITVEREVRG